MLTIKQDFLTILSAATSVVGLVVIFIASSLSQPIEMELVDVNSGLVGKVVTTSGFVSSEKLHEEGHVFLTISNGKAKLQVPIFSSLADQLRENDFPFSSLRNKVKVRITGTVDEYHDQLQIIPRKISDVEIL